MSGASVSLWTRSRFYATLVSTVLLNAVPFGAKFRSVCGPAMNCHGCPWSTTACPIGVLAYGSAMRALPALALGALLGIGLACGRLVCGFACPFGLLQDLLHRIPGPKIRLWHWTRYGKYAALALLVFALPFLMGFRVEGFLAFDKPQLSKAGQNVAVTITVRNPSPQAVQGVDVDVVYRTAEGVEMARYPQSFPEARIEAGGQAVMPAVEVTNLLCEADISLESRQAQVRQAIPLTYYCSLCPVSALESVVLPAAVRGKAPPGWADRNALRLAVLAGFLLLMWVATRAFCRTFCPLGAFYGLTHRIAFARIALDPGACVDCGSCRRACPIDLDVPKEVGGAECIACGDCIVSCPKGGIRRRWGW